MELHVYLTFNGNCREAMTFYQHCLGGELNFQTIGDSPLSDKMPQKMKACILHATLKNGALVLLGTDMVSESGLTKGNAVSISLNCKSEEEIRTCFGKLSEGALLARPIEHTHWGDLIGELTDKYGHHWLITFGLTSTLPPVQ